MKSAELNVQERKAGQRSENRRLRREGFVPANVYGPGTKNVECSFDERDLKRATRGSQAANVILTLRSSNSDLEGRKVVLKTLERDPVTWRLTHADLFQLDLSKPLELSIPIRLEGTPVGVKLSGGLLQVVRRSISVKALPTNIPEEFVVDISKMDLNESLHISDLSIPEGVESLDEGTYTIASVVEPKAEKVEEPAEEEASAEAGEAAADAGESAEAEPAKES